MATAQALRREDSGQTVSVHSEVAVRPEERRAERSIELCEGMIDVASAFFNVPSKEVRRPGRNGMAIARVRQIAMYVSHVVLRITMNEIGRGFGRDRTTVLHACHLIEDMRDDADFDGIVATLERVAKAAFKVRDED